MDDIIRHFFCPDCKRVTNHLQLDDGCRCEKCDRPMTSAELMDMYAAIEDDRGQAMLHEEKA